MIFSDPSATIYDLSASHQGPDTVKISWRATDANLRISIYHGTSPETIRREISMGPARGQSSVIVSKLDPGLPHYFKVVTEAGNAIIVSERRVPLEGTVNTRDLGGYETTDGQRIKWGKIFRSDHLARLTDADIAFLHQLKIKSVCDFRTETEVRNRPDRFPRGNSDTYVHLPVNHLKVDPTRLFEKLKKGDASWLTPEFLIEGYLINIEEFASIWGRVFKRLADPAHLPLLFHCTGGKDRAGTCAALILLALGVPEETVIEDYGLSNIYIADIVNQIYNEFKIDDEYRQKISPYFSAPQYCIEAMISHLNKNYGSPIAYLQSKAGVTAKMLKTIKAQLLE
jgi:protein-tyrosine phosphatase